MNPIDRSTPDALPQESATDSPSLCEYYRRSLENLRKRLPQLASELAATGVARVLVLYDGCGDSGQIEDIECRSADGEILELVSGDGVLKNLLYDLLEARHPGWENGDGACGEFVWELASGSLHHTHHDRFTDYDTTEHEGL